MPIRAGRFAASWAQATRDASMSPQLARLIAPARGLCPQQQLNYVQSAVQKQIRWVSDTTQWGQHDYWASAAQTLASGAGDEEDFAIVKLQALRALGFDRRDLFITLARDTVGGPLVVVVARVGNDHYVLDHSGGTPWRADSRRAEFVPSISFGWDTAWVHSVSRTNGSAATILAARR